MSRVEAVPPIPRQYYRTTFLTSLGYPFRLHFTAACPACGHDATWWNDFNGSKSTWGLECSCRPPERAHG